MSPVAQVKDAPGAVELGQVYVSIGADPETGQVQEVGVVLRDNGRAGELREVSVAGGWVLTAANGIPIELLLTGASLTPEALDAEQANLAAFVGADLAAALTASHKRLIAERARHEESLGEYLQLTPPARWFTLMAGLCPQSN